MADFDKQSMKPEKGISSHKRDGSTGMVIKNGVVSGSHPAMDGEPDFDTWLSQQLQFNEPHVDDAGFCDRVLAELPPVPAKRAERRATRYQYAAVVAASAIVCWQFPLQDLLASISEHSISLYSLVGVGILGAFAAMTGGIVAARR
uniref:hypothetical protein n=1 Tax=Microbulbifer agarilyticus TaxID=260552 RepID=UPI000255BB9F|nr:hypothetical protein [Microbulbifer agarilyticus]